MLGSAVPRDGVTELVPVGPQVRVALHVVTIHAALTALQDFYFWFCCSCWWCFCHWSTPEAGETMVCTHAEAGHDPRYRTQESAARARRAPTDRCVIGQRRWLPNCSASLSTDVPVLFLLLQKITNRIFCAFWGALCTGSLLPLLAPIYSSSFSYSGPKAEGLLYLERRDANAKRTINVLFWDYLICSPTGRRIDIPLYANDVKTT